MDVQKMQHTHNHSPLGKKRAKNPKRDDNRNKKKVPHIKDGHKKRRWPTQPQKRKPQFTKKEQLKKIWNEKKILHPFSTK